MSGGNQWSSTALPLSILLVLAALTFWLRYATELPEAQNDGHTRHDPDYVVTGATIRKLDDRGSLQYTLTAERVRHYPDSDTTDLDSPRLVYLHPTKPPVVVKARQGHLTAKGKTVELKEQVEIRRQASATDAELIVNSPHLTVLTDEEKAFTRSEVLITQGASWVRGVGMQVDNKSQAYRLESRVTGEIESRHGKRDGKAAPVSPRAPGKERSQ